MKKVLITGAAGFVGFHLSRYLMQQGVDVCGVDNLNSYYSTKLKSDRLAQLSLAEGCFRFFPLDIADSSAVSELFKQNSFDVVIHLAAQAGVRYSIENPLAYQHSNLLGMTVILEACRRSNISHLLYASSSSVYGGNTKVPFSETDSVDAPVSFYAATKRANEVMASTYSYMYKLPCTGLRFFTVYGPWGRPDMAYWSFSKAILSGQEIDVFGNGELSRDFTYVDDIVQSVYKLLDLPAQGERPHRVFNIGNHSPSTVNHLISVLEQALGKRAIQRFRPKPVGDVDTTFADCRALRECTGYSPQTNLEIGMTRFVEWYCSYHKVERSNLSN